MFVIVRSGHTRQFIGSDGARIRDFIFTAKIKAIHVRPENLAIEYIGRQ